MLLVNPEPTSSAMNTRRKFLLNGSMAATAMLAMKPFTSMANSLGPVTGLRINSNSLVLAHTGNNLGNSNAQFLHNIANLKNNYSNLLMLHAGNKVAVPNAAYDASMHANAANVVAPTDYRIVYKGNIKTGIISAEKASADSINALAVYLKKEKNCHLVVCLSQLGYKSASGLNDLSLAASSTHLDIIIGGHAGNFCSSPVIARNQNKQEVIINHAATNGLALRKIEINFDTAGRKNLIAFTKTC